MLRDKIEGGWRRLVGRAREAWGRITDDDGAIASGRHERLIGRLQQRYGYARAQAEKEVTRWEKHHDYHW